MNSTDPAAHEGAGHYGETLFNAGHPREAERIDDAAVIYDPVTTHRLRALGVGPGARCLEVGAGTGTVARWLLREAGAREVVALDRDTSALGEAPEQGLRVVTADVTDDSLDLGTFDLIHARFVLMHLPERRRVLARLATRLNPGGRLLLGDAVELPDTLGSTSPYRRTMDAMWEALRTTIGTDISAVPTYPHLLRKEGLADVGTELYCPPLVPDGPLAHFWSQTLQRMRPELVATGGVDAATVEECLAYLSSPTLAELAPGILLAWGRRL